MTENKITAARERVTATAMGLFRKMGIKGVRMDDVARECGISKRTLYELFEDREQLIYECLAQRSREEDANNRAIAEGAENVLHAFWLIFSQNKSKHPGDVAIVVQLHRYYPKVLRKLMVDIHETVVAQTRQELQKGVEDGLIMPIDNLEFFARAMTNYIYGLGIIEQHTSITGVVMDERSIPYAVLVFLRGISTEKGMHYIDNNILKTK